MCHSVTLTRRATRRERESDDAASEALGERSILGRGGASVTESGRPDDRLRSTCVRHAGHVR
eukprot:4435392-Prymnesium_polylepis.1